MHIGISGHQYLPSPEQWAWLETAISVQLERIAVPLIGVTSLAIGCDQLFAKLVLNRGGRILAILPFEDIERTFDEEHIADFQELVSGAEIEILERIGSDEDQYLAAGQRVVNLADLVFAVWNGKPARGKGGTADIVQFAREGGIPLLVFNPEDRTVTEFVDR